MIASPAFSERPLGEPPGKGPPRPVTWPDVALRIVYDGPAYAIVGLIGVLALRGQAESVHVVLAGFGALLSRSWPRAVQVGAASALAMVVMGESLSACIVR